MSRIGRNPISLPDGINVKLQGSTIAVKGPKGELKWDMPAGLKVTIQDKNLKVERPSETKQFRSLHGTTRSIIANMVLGVSAGFQKNFDIMGVGYKAQVQGKKIVFTLGYSHPVEFAIPEGISAEVDKKMTKLTIQGIDKQLVGQVAANIRALRPRMFIKARESGLKENTLRLRPVKQGNSIRRKIE